MEGYQILLNVEPQSAKSKYPFVIMDELEIKKTRKYIDIELTDALKTTGREKNKKYTGGSESSSAALPCDDGVCSVMFVDFS